MSVHAAQEAQFTGGFRSKSDVAYSVVKRMILDGDLEPGGRINQEQLAGRIGMSTTPLREALRRLSSEGLVAQSAHHDALVTSLSAVEARDLFETRLPLDILAVRLAAERIDEDTAVSISAAASSLTPDIQSPDSPDDYLASKRSFHASLYRASRNETLIGVLDKLWDQAGRYRQHAIRHGLREYLPRLDQHQEHLEMRDAVLKGDADRAEQLMEAHVIVSRDRLLMSLEGKDIAE